jgi:hypothetical protein
MTASDVNLWITNASQSEREAVFRHVRTLVTIHPLERTLQTTAEVILAAIERAGGLTLRMIRGVIAEAVFDVEVAGALSGWQRMPVSGNQSFDVQLNDPQGAVRVQVKLQRSKGGRPMTANQAVKTWSARRFVTETQKTRGGTKTSGKKTRPQKPRPVQSTRPYRFGEFDVLAVSLYPSAGRWDRFMYTVGNWLVPDPTDTKCLLKFQPVAGTPDSEWTDDFLTAVAWFRSGVQKTISTT